MLAAARVAALSSRTAASWAVVGAAAAEALKIQERVRFGLDPDGDEDDDNGKSALELAAKRTKKAVKVRRGKRKTRWWIDEKDQWVRGRKGGREVGRELMVTRYSFRKIYAHRSVLDKSG
jgi:hypothetical protein